MAEETTTAVTPPAGDPADTSPQAGESHNQDTISLDEARKLRSEAANLRKREKEVLAQLKAYQDKEQQTKDAELSELDLSKKQLAQLQEQHEQLAAELYEARVFQDVGRLASKFNFMISSDTVARMLMLDEDKIEFENGKPTNIEKLLDALAKREPDLVRKPQAPSEQQPGNQQQQRPQPPQVPAMNPGRAAIPAPGTVPPGKRPSLAEAYALAKQQQQG